LKNMQDSYQPIYDAVRSKISGGDIGAAVERVAREMFDISHVAHTLKQEIVHNLQQEFGGVAEYMIRPSVLYRPSLAPDGTMWCALYGENLAEGVAGFGETPADAMRAFDEAWIKQRTPHAIQRASLKERDDAATS
jgi:hypothetical protein